MDGLSLDHGWFTLGTRGNWNGKSYTISGCIRAASDYVNLSYWSLIFDDGSTAVLEEGFGNYSILEKETGIKNIAIELQTLKINDAINLLPSESFTLIKKNTSKIRVAGEVWMEEPTKGNKDIRALLS